MTKTLQQLQVRFGLIEEQMTTQSNKQYFDNVMNRVGMKECMEEQEFVEFLKQQREKLEREIDCEYSSIWSSSEGILGADDRAGVAVILSVVKSLDRRAFSGTLKIALTVEEEIGLVGARNVDSAFLEGIDMAFVVDRRGTGDIVTSCGGYEPFCSEQFSSRIERFANKVEDHRWKVVAGGSSDTRIWASHGIESINLSAGFCNEHTDAEILDVEANYGTYLLVQQLVEYSDQFIGRPRNRQRRYHINNRTPKVVLTRRDEK